MESAWVLLIPLFPWVGGLLIVAGMLVGSNRGESGERLTAIIAQFAIGLPLLGMLFLDLIAWQSGLLGEVVLFPWFTSGQFQIFISLLLDRPALVMGTLVAVSVFLTLRFSIHYLHREVGFHRFFAIMCLFAGGMEWIALSGNAVLTFVGWEMAGLSSYLLIAYAYTRATATRNATRAFITNRIGDAGFILGIVMAFLLAGSMAWSEIFYAASRISSLLAGVMAAGFLLAAVAKSAQMPFLAWLSRALEGPTPSSGIFYGAIMSHAGAFLVIRLEPLLRHSLFWMVMLMLIGLVTATLAAAIGRVQSDVKSALIYSTQAQIGLIFAECGAGLFEFALWHLVVHTIWRLYQFLLSPSYLHLAQKGGSSLPSWLAGAHSLYGLVLQRFWVDSLTDALITRPTLALGREVQIFDNKVVSRMAGRPVQENRLTVYQDGGGEFPLSVGQDNLNAIRGRGVLGRLLEKSALFFSWFEERLVLNSSGDGLVRFLTFLGGYVMRIELLLAEPRYLYLLIALTFVIML